MFSRFKKKDEPVIDKPKPAWAQLANRLAQTDTMVPNFYPAPQLPQGVMPDGHDMMAMDGFCTASQYAGLDAQFYSSYLGYPMLTQLSQSAEYRLVAETFAQEMTREWGGIKGEDKAKAELLEKEMLRLDIRNLMRKHIENDYLFGGSQMYISIKGQEDKTDLPLLINERGIQKGMLDGFVVREPMWSTPSAYNASDALAKDFFMPEQWWVLGKSVHHSRLLTLTMRPVGDMLKPVYNFYGIAMTQLMLPYVQRLQRSIDSTADVIEAFSLTGLKTDMTNLISGTEGAASEFVNRIKTIGLGRKNNNVVAVDKDTEEFFQINTPLSGLDVLLNIMIQMVCYPSKIPVLKLYGTPTAGLGNTSDGEIRVFYDTVSAQQEAFLMPQMNVILRCLQLNLFGEVDEDITFKFNPLYQLDDNERADVNLKKAQIAQIYIQEGVIDNDEARDNLSEDEESGYQLTGNAPEPDPYTDVDNVDIEEK